MKSKKLILNIFPPIPMPTELMVKILKMVTPPPFKGVVSWEETKAELRATREEL